MIAKALDGKPLTLAFTTFLKICTRKPRGKIGEVKRFTQKGGYDFYKRMKQVAVGLAKEQITLNEAKRSIAGIGAFAERAHALAGIERLGATLNSWRLEWSEPPEGSYVSSSGLLVIKLRPDLAFVERDGLIRCVYLWNLAKPDLITSLAGEGLWLPRAFIGGDEHAFAILDLRTGALHTEKSVTAACVARAKLDLLLIEESWKDLHNPGISHEEAVAHLSSLTVPPSP